MTSKMSEAEVEVLIRMCTVGCRFSERISKLPKDLQDMLLADLETAIENRVKVLEMAQ